MITANPNSALGWWCRKVAAMKPGEYMRVSRYDLQDIPTFEHNGALFTAADRILGNIVGSGYTHSFRVDPLDGSVVFRRHEETDRRTYIDPDYRAINPGATNAR